VEIHLGAAVWADHLGRHCIPQGYARGILVRP
jgi:hypothetical protein